jgi:hypothetical protein
MHSSYEKKKRSGRSGLIFVSSETFAKDFLGKKKVKLPARA